MSDLQPNETIRAEHFDYIARYGADSVGTDAYAITSVQAPILAYAEGQKFRVKIGTANTGASTLDVDGLGAIAIKKDVNKPLETGDLLAGQIAEFSYDGTYMQLMSRIPTKSTTAGVGNPPATSSTQTITHSLGRIPKIIRIKGFGDFFLSTGSANSNTQPTSSYGTYNSTGNMSTRIDQNNTGSGRGRPTNDSTNAVYVTVNSSTAAGVIGNVGATTFDIVWTVSGTNGQYGTYHWEAE